MGTQLNSNQSAIITPSNGSGQSKNIPTFVGQIIESFPSECISDGQQAVIDPEHLLTEEEESFAKKFSSRWPTVQDLRNSGVYCLTCLLLNASWSVTKTGIFIKTVAEYAGDQMAGVLPMVAKMYGEAVKSEQYADGAANINVIFGSKALDDFWKDLGIGRFEDKWIQDQIDKFNERHAKIWLSSKLFILRETYDPALKRPTVEYCSLSNVKLANGHLGKIPDPFDTKKMIHFVDAWAKHPDGRQYEGIVFDPSKQAPPEFFNLWTDFSVQAKVGDWSLYRNHIREVIADGDQVVADYIEAWMADAVQNHDPSKKPGVGIILKGGQGTGKGVFATQFGELFGHHFIHLSNPDHLVGKYSKHLQSANLVFADEMKWGRSQKGIETLKRILTESTLTIEPKGKDSFNIANHIHLMVASNESWVMQVDHDDRRFLVVDVNSAHAQDVPYFEAIIDQMNSGGREALLHYLQEYDLNGVDLRKIPWTRARVEQQYLSLPMVGKFWFHLLTTGFNDISKSTWLTSIPTIDLQAQYHDFVKGNGVSKKQSDTELGINLKKFVPGLNKPRTRPNGGSAHHYQVPDLQTCQDALFKGYDWSFPI